MLHSVCFISPFHFISLCIISLDLWLPLWLLLLLLLLFLMLVMVVSVMVIVVVAVLSCCYYGGSNCCDTRSSCCYFQLLYSYYKNRPVRLTLACFCIDDFLLMNSRSARRKKKWVTGYWQFSLDSLCLIAMKTSELNSPLSSLVGRSRREKWRCSVLTYLLT